MHDAARRSLALAALACLLAGCAESAPGAPAFPNDADAGAPPEPGLRRSTASANASFEVASAVPFQQVVWQGGCFEFALDVPAAATMLRVTLSGPPANVSRPGAGFMTFLLRPDGGEWREPAQGGLRDEVEATVPIPEAGPWQVWVWPNGPVVHQSWTLTAEAEAAGPGVVALRQTDPAC